MLKLGLRSSIEYNHRKHRLFFPTSVALHSCVLICKQLSTNANTIISVDRHSFRPAYMAEFFFHIYMHRFSCRTEGIQCRYIADICSVMDGRLGKTSAFYEMRIIAYTTTLSEIPGSHLRGWDGIT